MTLVWVKKTSASFANWLAFDKTKSATKICIKLLHIQNRSFCRQVSNQQFYLISDRPNSIVEQECWCCVNSFSYLVKNIFQSGLPRPNHNLANTMLTNLHRKIGGRFSTLNQSGQSDRFFELTILTPSEFIARDIVIILFVPKVGGMAISFVGSRVVQYSKIALMLVSITQRRSAMKSSVEHSPSPQTLMFIRAEFTCSDFCFLDDLNPGNFPSGNAVCINFSLSLEHLRYRVEQLFR